MPMMMNGSVLSTHGLGAFAQASCSASPRISKRPFACVDTNYANGFHNVCHVRVCCIFLLLLACTSSVIYSARIHPQQLKRPCVQPQPTTTTSPASHHMNVENMDPSNRLHSPKPLFHIAAQPTMHQAHYASSPQDCAMSNYYGEGLAHLSEQEQHVLYQAYLQQRLAHGEDL